MTQAIRVAKDKDNNLVQPSEGYESTLEVDLDDWTKVGELSGGLPPSPVNFPLGAPDPGLCVVGNGVFKKKA